MYCPHRPQPIPCWVTERFVGMGSVFSGMRAPERGQQSGPWSFIYRWIFLFIQIFLWVSNNCFPSGSPCQYCRLAGTYVCSEMFGLVWFGLQGFGAPLWWQLQVLKSITAQVAGGSPQHSAVCSRLVPRNQAGPSCLPGKCVVFQGPAVSCKP